jgi:ArsR family transcriptional regulator
LNNKTALESNTKTLSAYINANIDLYAYLHQEVEMFDEDLIQIESDFLKAIAQPTRLKILYFLKGGERCACEIIPKMKEDQSNISRHLTHMKDMGILESRKEGVSVYYKIKDRRIFHLLSLVDEMVKAEIKEKARKVKILT